jgi:molybdopterin converting factor small subunit
MTKILFFGRLGDQFGREIDFDLPNGGCSVRELRELLMTGLPGADDSLRARSTSICVDEVILLETDHIGAPREIAILPPVSGG